jgi:murein DD-endopeptidase MepM/ murein hydrolase activator NlpD
MVAESSSRGRRLFPEINITLRTRNWSSQIPIIPVVQIAIASALVVIAGAVFLFGVGWLRSARTIGIREAAVVRAEGANTDSQNEVASLRNQPVVVLSGREQAGGQASTLGRLLSIPDADLRLVDDHVRAARPARKVRPPSPPSEEISSAKLGGPFRLAGLITEEISQFQGDASRSEMPITDAPAEPLRDPAGVAEFGRRAVNEFVRMLASTGLNVARLFPQLGINRSEGGPFVPPPKGLQSDGISLDKLEVMRSVMKSLPLSAPLEEYQLESPFGPRRDPFNHRLSFHTGLDLSAPYMSAVYATAPGLVTYAGYLADYGKVVEISHGNGIATVYGHLHRYTVVVGQTVTEHTQIGFLGSTGRSSGPHVHYEIRVNDEPQDPEKFLGLAHVIPAADK